jgi:ABC-type Na+ efflux pump permease subunit
MTHRPPGDAEMTWLIAQRAALEALRDRLTLLTGIGFAMVLPLLLLLLVIRPFVAGAAADTSPPLGGVLAFYLLVVGLPPTVSSVGIAAGQFAGEKERGVLTPLLASPASNLAIFGGKVLGAILPALLYAAVAETVYLLGLALLLGPETVGQLPMSACLAMIVLVPAVACFAAVVASLVSSRVRTYNAAQQIGGLVLMPVWGIVFAVALRLQESAAPVLFGAVAGLVLLDALLTVIAASTWRREEVLAQR